MGSSLLIYFLGAVLCFASLVMILLVLLQRGRGGGLAGAFGGMGGQSALGVRAGDVFTKITVVIAVIWVVVAGLLGISMRAADVAKKDQVNPDLGLTAKADEIKDGEGAIDEGAPIVVPTATADDPETEKAETGAAKTDPASDPASTTEIPEAVEGKKAESAETTPDEAAAPEEKTDSVAAEKKDEPAPEAEPE